MWTLRIILILVGIACLVGLYLYMRKHPPRRERDDNAAPRIEPEWRMPSDERHLPPAGETQASDNAGGTEAAAKQDSPAARDQSSRGKQQSPEQDAIFMLAVKLPEAGVDTQTVLHALRRLGCRPNRDGIYHELNDANQTLYTVANLFEPGLLDPPPAAERLHGLVLFFAKQPERDEAATFDHMLGAARDLAKTLGGEVQDDAHRPLTAARELELKLAASRHG